MACAGQAQQRTLRAPGQQGWQGESAQHTGVAVGGLIDAYPRVGHSPGQWRRALCRPQPGLQHPKWGYGSPAERTHAPGLGAAALMWQPFCLHVAPLEASNAAAAAAAAPCLYLAAALVQGTCCQVLGALHVVADASWLLLLEALHPPAGPNASGLWRPPWCLVPE